MQPLEPFTDIHCHMLPGMDDGARSWTDALAMARLAVGDGIETVVVTPHQLGGYAHNHGDAIRNRTLALQQALDEQDVPLRVLPGADVRIDDRLVTLLRQGDIVSLGDHGRHLLLELPHELYLPLEPLLDQLGSAGLTGILSHPERNRGILARPDVIQPLVAAGCLMQVTAGSLTGWFGRSVQKLAESLIDQGLVHFVSSDAHAVRGRTPLLGPAFDRVSALTDRRTAVDLFCRNPAHVAHGKPVPAGCRGRPERRARWFGWSRRKFLTSSGVFAAAALGLTATDCGAADRWTDDRQVGPFHCRAGFSLDPFGPLLADLEHLQAELVRTLAIAPADRPIDVYLFEDRASYRAFVRRRLPHVPCRRALFVKTGGHCEVFVYRHDQFQIDLRHECTHALLHSALAMVPLWLDEGLAEYFEVPSGQRADGHPHLTRLKWNMRLGIIPSLEDLEGKERVEQMGVLEYRFSWAWVHFMFHGPGRVHRALVAYLADIRTGAPPGRLSQRLAATSADIERQMIDHFKRWRRATTSCDSAPRGGHGSAMPQKPPLGKHAKCVPAPYACLGRNRSC